MEFSFESRDGDRWKRERLLEECVARGEVVAVKFDFYHGQDKLRGKIVVRESYGIECGMPLSVEYRCLFIVSSIYFLNGVVSYYLWFLLSIVRREYSFEDSI